MYYACRSLSHNITPCSVHITHINPYRINITSMSQVTFATHHTTVISRSTHTSHSYDITLNHFHLALPYIMSVSRTVQAHHARHTDITLHIVSVTSHSNYKIMNNTTYLRWLSYKNKTKRYQFSNLHSPTCI